MRITAVLCLLLALSMIFVPLLSLKGEKTVPASKIIVSETEKMTTEKAENDETIKVLITKTGKVEEMPLDEYVAGVIFAEISPLYSEEAIKAQAIACRTYALYKKNEQKENENNELNGAYLSDDYTKYQGYLSKSDARKKWGNQYASYSKKITSAVSEVSDLVIKYKGKLILPAYFALCSGYTESAENVWGGKVDYLVSVPSKGDKLAASLTSKKNFTTEEFKKCTEKLENCSLGDNVQSWISSLEATKIGTVKKITIGNSVYSGTEIQNAFNLKSNNFTVLYSKSGFTFTVTGNGHCVGMSQYGADYMARQGSTYKEILTHYYKGVSIEKF